MAQAICSATCIWLLVERALCGSLLLYRIPQRLFEENPVLFATLLDVLGSEAQHHVAAGVPFHVVLGPVSGACAGFINLLHIAPYVTYFASH